MELRQSTASQEILLGYFLDPTDGDTEEAALTIANTDIKLFKSGATTLANKNSGGATHISNGLYYATLDATDTNTAGNLEVLVHVAGALVVRREYEVVTQSYYDAKYTGTFNNLGGTAQTGDSYARLGAPAGASVSADNAAIKAETNSTLTDTNDLVTNGVDVASINGTTVQGDGTALDLWRAS